MVWRGVNRVGSFSSFFRMRRVGHTDIRLVHSGLQASRDDARVTMFYISGSEYVQETQDSPGLSECFHKMKTNSILILRNYPHHSSPTRIEVCGILRSHHCYASMGGSPCFQKENIFMLSWLIETQQFGRMFKAPMTKALETAVSGIWWAFVWHWRQDVISSYQPHWYTRTGEVKDLLSHLYCQSLNRDVGSSTPFLTMWSGTLLLKEFPGNTDLSTNISEEQLLWTQPTLQGLPVRLCPQMLRQKTHWDKTRLGALLPRFTPSGPALSYATWKIEHWLFYFKYFTLKILKY